MFFGEVPLDQALNCYLAHSLKLPSGRLRKGTLLEENHLEQLAKAGIDVLTVARLDENDIHEDEAAMLIASAVSGLGISCESARTGRVNLYAKHEGLFCLDRKMVLSVNAVSTAITVSTLAENSWVSAGRLIATVKIIPYGVPRPSLNTAVACCSDKSKLSVEVPVELDAHLIQTQLPGTSASMLDKTREVTQQRLKKRQATLASEIRCAHVTSQLQDVLLKIINSPETNPGDCLLITGASAISDGHDVIPAAITAAGGQVIRYGIPVDPGNLLLLGKLHKHWVIGLPGCARSAKYNGFDQLLDRLVCDLPISNDWIDSLSVGGLMGEILERPSPRIPVTRISAASVPAETAPPESRIAVNSASTPSTVGVLLAAGSSRRFGKQNKLLASTTASNLSLVWQALLALLHSKVSRIVVVTGHEHERVEYHLRKQLDDHFKNQASSTQSENETHQLPAYQVNCKVSFIYNRNHASGMASSLITAIAPLAIELNKQPSLSEAECDVTNHDTPLPADSVVVCLGDMPGIGKEVIDTLLNSREMHPEKAAFVPCYQGQPGNPVLFSSSLFDSVLALQGDMGARGLLKENTLNVINVDVDNPNILIDFDTPEQLSHKPDT